MEKNIYCQKLPERMYQKCPLCNEPHPMVVHGMVNDIEGGHPKVAYDKGYSFCNCRDIFYTDKRNLNKNVYDDWYAKKYDFYLTKNIAKEEAAKYLAVIKKSVGECKTFFEVGAIEDTVLDYAKEKGMEVSGIDITNHESKHSILNIDFEKYISENTYDIVWASHVFEHFIDPIAQLDKIRKMTNKACYIAMPDTFFIDFGNVMQWDWNCDEHHILWSMESFVELAEERGWRCIYNEHSTDLYKQKDNTWFWKQDFKIVLV